LEISDINKKTLVILQAFPEPIINLSEQSCRSYFKSHPENVYGQIPYSLVSINLLYSFARNFKFLKCPLYIEIIAASISEEHRISLQHAKELISKMLGALSKFGLCGEIEVTNADFIKSLVLEIGSCWDLNDCAKNLALPISFVSKVEEFLFSNEEEIADIEFLSSIDTEIISVISDISNKIEFNSRWKIDKEKLNFKYPFPKELVEIDSSVNGSLIFEICIFIGKATEVRRSEIVRLLKSKLAEDQISLINNLLCYLVDARILKKTVQSLKDQKYMLTSYGFEISANYFAEYEVYCLSSNNLPKLSPKWSEALFGQPNAISLIKDILGSNYPLDQHSLKRVSGRICQANDKDLNREFFVYLNKLLSNSQNPYLRRTCVDIIAKHYNKKTSPDFFSDLFENDTSSAVQASALKAMLTT
jgi:hypothetical protein